MLSSRSSNLIIDFFLNDEFRTLIYDLIDAGVTVKKFDRNIIETKISNKIVLITGSLESMSRAEAKVKIEILGAKLSSSLSKKTNFTEIKQYSGLSGLVKRSTFQKNICISVTTNKTF